MKAHLLAGLVLTIAGLAVSVPARAEDPCASAFDAPDKWQIARRTYLMQQSPDNYHGFKDENSMMISAGWSSYDDCVFRDMGMIRSDSYHFSTGDIDPISGRVFRQDSDVYLAASFTEYYHQGWPHVGLAIEKRVNGETEQVIGLANGFADTKTLFFEMRDLETKLAEQSGQREKMMYRDNPKSDDPAYMIHFYKRLAEGSNIANERINALDHEPSMKQAPTP